MLLLSVPYALKAGDAATIGGLPPSAFVLAAPGSGSAQAAPQETGATPGRSSSTPANADVTGLGTIGYILLECRPATSSTRCCSSRLPRPTKSESTIRLLRPR